MSGWQLVATISIGVFLLVVLAIFLGLREGRSRRFRIGLFIERENIEPLDEYPVRIDDTLVDQSEWPTRH